MPLSINYWSADPAFLSQTTSAGKGGKSLLKALTEQIDACIDQQRDQLHFDAKGAEMLGRRFYEKLVELGIII